MDILARYQCVSYFDRLGDPFDPQPRVDSKSSTFFWRVIENNYIVFSFMEIDGEGAIDYSQLKQLHHAIEYANDSLLLKSGVWGNLETPDFHGFALLFDVLGRKMRVDFPTSGLMLLPHFHFDSSDLSKVHLPKERQDFLAIAERAPIGRARLPDYVKLLEAAFACAGDRLIEQVEPFLAGSPMFSEDTAYSSKEIKKWIKVRGSLVHADRRKNWGDFSDVWPLIPRLRQACHDVVWNKRDWNVRNSKRVERCVMNVVLRAPPGEGLKIRAKTGDIKVGAFNVDVPGFSFANPTWLQRMCRLKSVERIDYLNPLFDRFPKCSIPDDHIDPRRSALFMARSILREVREVGRAC